MSSSLEKAKQQEEEERRRIHRHKFHFVELRSGWTGASMFKNGQYWCVAVFVCEKCGLIKYVKTKEEKTILNK